MTALSNAFPSKSFKTKSTPFGSSRVFGEKTPEIAAALTEQAKLNWNSDVWRAEVAADLEAVFDYGFEFENLFGQYFQVETVGEADRPIHRERKGLKAFFTSRGGDIDESQIFDEVWGVVRDTIGIHFTEHEDKLRLNFGTSLIDLVTLGQARMEAEINRRIFTMLQAAVPSSAANYTATAGLTKTEVDSSIRAVRDAIKPDGTPQIPVTIIGRASMVDQISDFNLGFDPEATEEIRAKGRLGVYRAANVINVKNYADENGVSYIPANELWIFGGKVGSFYEFGPTRVSQWTEHTKDIAHIKARKDVGGVIIHPEQAWRIVDSNVTP